MTSDQITLINSRIRLALHKKDSKAIIDAARQLAEGNPRRTQELDKWFEALSKSFHKNEKLTFDIVEMRMWFLGNMDIVEISNEGKPSFCLTTKGKEKIKENPKEKWSKMLLWE